MIDEIDDDLATTIVEHTYCNYNVIPMSMILTGSRAYGCATSKSDYDLIGIHLTDTWNCLEHPRYQKTDQVINIALDTDLEYVSQSSESALYSVTSFEVWKFIDIWEKGAFAAHEILFMPTIHHNASIDAIEHLMRQGCSNKIGYAAEHCNRDFKEGDISPRNLKRLIYYVYRVLQALYMLQEEVFEWDIQELWDYGQDLLVPSTNILLEKYLDRENQVLIVTPTELEEVLANSQELVKELQKMRALTKLPEKCPPDTLNRLLKCLRTMRGSLI